MSRPSTAPRLLVYLLWAHPPLVQRDPEGGQLVIPSIWKLSVRMGTQSNRLKGWLIWLESHGYITGLAWSPNRRSCRLSLVRPPNI